MFFLVKKSVFMFEGPHPTETLEIARGDWIFSISFMQKLY